jgi:hypothetical protein
MSGSGARIIRLDVEAVKRIKAVSLDCTGANAVIVGGDNEQGKTSLLDAIMYAFAGARSIPAKPVHDGANGAHVEVVLDNGFKVRREWDAAGASKIRVTTTDGARFDKPQAVLESMLGDLSFDPLAFDRMEAKEQAAALARITGLKLDDLDDERERVYDERTEIGRDLKNAKSAADGLPEYPGAEPVDVAALLEEQRKAHATYEKMRASDSALYNAQRVTNDVQSKIDDLRQRLSALEGDLQNARELEDVASKSLDDARAALIDPAPIDARIASAGAENAKVQANAAKAAAVAKAADLETTVAEKTARIDQIDAEKAARVAAVQMPVKGMALGRNGVTIDGIPWKQCSSAQRLEASVAMGFAANPKLRVILVRDGSLLDWPHLQRLCDLASQHDGQVIIERVGNGPECSIVIEDGMVKE